MSRGELSLAEKAILIGLAGSALILNPMSGRVVVALAKYYFKKWWDEGGPYVPPENDPKQVRASLYRLKRNNYISWKYNKRKSMVVLKMTAKGKKFFSNVKRLEDVKIVRPKKWDGSWRFVLFDIPEKSRTFRDAFRYHIKTIGFFRFQKSVWIYPFPCEKEVRYFAECLGITPFVIIFTAKVENDRILRRYFLKRKILLRVDVSLFDKGVHY